MPRFQGSLETTRGSNEWARDNRKTIFSPNVEAIRRATEALGELHDRGYGARDFRDIGHKAIFVANSYRTLVTIGSPPITSM